MKRRREITSNKMFNSIFISQQNRCDMINFQLPTNSMEKLTQKLSKSESLSFIVMSLPPLSFALISGGTLLVWASWEHDGNTKANEMRSGGKAISRFTFFTFLCKLHSGKIKWQKNFMFFLSLSLPPLAPSQGKLSHCSASVGPTLSQIIHILTTKEAGRHEWVTSQWSGRNVAERGRRGEKLCQWDGRDDLMNENEVHHRFSLCRTDSSLPRQSIKQIPRMFEPWEKRNFLNIWNYKIVSKCKVCSLSSLVPRQLDDGTWNWAKIQFEQLWHWLLSVYGEKKSFAATELGMEF